MPILRPTQPIIFYTPSYNPTTGTGTVGLSVCCADSYTSRWAWSSYRVSTVSTPNAVTTASYVAWPENIAVSGTDTSTGTNTQIVLRTMFAYIADAPIIIQGETNFSASFDSPENVIHSTTFEIYTKIFYPDGSVHSEFLNENVVVSNPTLSSRTVSGVRRFNGYLPATSCPLVVFSWIRSVGTIPAPLTSKTVSGDIKIKLGLTPPEIAVERDGINIPINGTSDLGTFNVGSAIGRTFEIRNYGANGLTLSGSPRVLLSGDTTSFAVWQQPSGYISGFGLSELIIRFSSLTAGTKQATATIVNDDSDENPFVFNITATANPLGEIQVEQPVSTIIDNNGTKNFGSVSVNSSKSLTFTIRDLSNSGIILSGQPRVEVFDGPNQGDFLVTSYPSTTVPANGSTSFIVQFTARGLGTRSAAIKIINSDGDENPFIINVTGTGV